MTSALSARLTLALLLAVACAAPRVTTRPSAAATISNDTSAVASPARTNPFDEYVGQYAATDAGDMVISIYADSGRWWMQPTDNPRFEIVAARTDTFDVPMIKHRLAFLRDAAGRVTGVRVRSGDFDHPVAPRISDRPIIVRFVAMTRTDTMIPMRDGTRLHTVIVAPSAPAGPLPFMLQRTPYGVAHWDAMGVNVALRSLVADGSGGYIFVFQDIRGRFGSEGHFEMMRPPRETQAAGARPAVDESTDAWDTIDWLVHHVPRSNGRVGIRGVSYDGWLATMALRGAHPALRAASPQAPVGDLWQGDDFFHNGAFRLSYGYEFATMLESSNEMSEAKLGGEGDAYDWYLRLGSLTALDSLVQGRLPTWTAFVEHPSYDAYWRARDVRPQINRPGDRRVPTLVVGGRWDQEDPLGPLVTYAALERGGLAAHERARARALAPRPMVDGQCTPTRRAELEDGDRPHLPRLRGGALVRALAEGHSRAGTSRSARLSLRRRQVGSSATLARTGGRYAPALPARQQRARIRSATRRSERVGPLPVRSVQPRSIPGAPDQGDIRRGDARLVELACRRSAVRRRPAGRAALADRAARRGRDGDR